METKLASGIILVLKKQHPCGSNRWLLQRKGLECRIKCLGCGHVTLMAQEALLKAIKKVEGPVQDGVGLSNKLDTM